MSIVEPPILLKTKLPDLLPTVQLERYVNVGGNHVRRRARCPLINNENDAELACKVHEEFLDICTADRFDLNTGALKFEFFRQCMTGQARAHWDVAVANNPGGTDNDFNAAVTEWFAQYFEPTALHDQKQYLLNSTKPFAMSVKETATRVEEIIRFMSYMPGAPAAGTPVYSDLEKKMVLYRLMRANWKTNFDASGSNITDPNYTWNNLITYMSAQEKKENKNAFNTGRGRGRPPGGRGRGGRGSYGTTRRLDYQGGRASQRFRPNNYGQGQGYLPAPYGSGYGRGQYGYGYGQSNSYGGYGYGGGRGYNAGAGRGYVGGRGAGGRGAGGHGAGRGRFQGRGREARALHHDPGYQNRAGRTTRSGGAYVADGVPGAYVADNSAAQGQESFDSGNTSQESEPTHAAPYEGEMYYGEGENGDEFDYDFGYGEDYGEYGDYGDY